MGRIIEATHHFAVEGLGVNGYTTKKNVYLNLNGKSVDLIEFKKAAIRYIGLSLDAAKLNDYISVYREVSEKFNIKIDGLEDEKFVKKSSTPVEVLSNDDSAGDENASEVPEGDSELAIESSPKDGGVGSGDGKTKVVETTTSEGEKDPKEEVGNKPEPEPNAEEKKANVLKEEVPSVEKPKRRVRSRGKTKGLSVKPIPNK